MTGIHAPALHCVQKVSRPPNQLIVPVTPERVVSAKRFMSKLDKLYKVSEICTDCAMLTFSNWKGAHSVDHPCEACKLVMLKQSAIIAGEKIKTHCHRRSSLLLPVGQ